MKAKQIHLATWADQVNYYNRICSMNLNKLEHAGFDISYENHAKAILDSDFSRQLDELIEILLAFEIQDFELLEKGGGKSNIVTRLGNQLKELKWSKHNFEIRKIVDENEQFSSSHEVDHVCRTEKGNIALEIEWTTKDTSFDRDLENFRRLHSENAISAGIIITRGKSLQDNIENIIMKFIKNNNIQVIEELRKYENKFTGLKSTFYSSDFSNLSDVINEWTRNLKKNRFANSTSHWDNLEKRIKRGVGNPCPLYLIGIPDTVIVSKND